MNMLKNITAKVGAVVVGALAPVAVFAQTQYKGLSGAVQGLKDVGGKTDLGGKDLPALVGGIINAVLGFVGIILLGYLLYAGFLWMTAGGDSKKTDEAKTMIKNAIIGLVILISSVAISNFVINMLVTSTTG